MKIIYNEQGAKISKNGVTLELTSVDIDRIVAFRDAYHREKHHRGYPINDKTD